MSSSGWDLDTAVIGGGPGGGISALYLKRFKRRVLLINNGISRASWIPKTFNLIGYNEGISGCDLLIRISKQLDKHHVDRIKGLAYATRRRGGGYNIHVGSDTYSAKTVILATGIQDIQPEIPNLEKLRKKGLLRYCPVCDGYGFCDQPLAVLIREDDGVDKALFIRHFSSRVKVVLPPEQTLSKQKENKLLKAGIKIVKGKLLGMEECHEKPGIWLSVDGHRPFFSRIAYVELGCEVPDFAFSKIRNIPKSSSGFLCTTTEQRLGVPGLFGVGDCVNLLGQISVAAGQAAVAATTIHNDLLP